MRTTEIVLEHDVKIVFTGKVTIIHSGKEQVILLPYQAKWIAKEILKHYANKISNLFAMFKTNPTDER